MPRFVIVNADTPEPEAVEKPVELKWELDTNGEPGIWARQNGGWVQLGFVNDDGILHLYVNGAREITTLPGLAFTINRVWSVE